MWDCPLGHVEISEDVGAESPFDIVRVDIFNRFNLVLFGGIGAVMGQLRMTAPAARIALSSGVVDMAANVFYLTATRFGPLSVMVTLTSLYPASTVILARVVLGERLNPWQAAGVACALAAIVLIVGAG